MALWGNSAGGAATATFTRASNAEDEFVLAVELAVEDGVLELDDGGWKAIIDLREDAPLPAEDSPLCLEYDEEDISPVPRFTVRLLELMDILARVEPARDTCRVDTLGRSDGADLARPRKGAAFISVSRTLGLVPAGLSIEGANLLVVPLVPFL